MEGKTAKIMCKIAHYPGSDGTYRITIPKSVIDELQLQKGDHVVITITPAFRPSTEGA